MKLLRLKLHTDFRSLPAGFEIKFPMQLHGEQISPICLVGLNGSGKSNLLELLSEIFYYVDGYHLEYASDNHKEQKGFGFEIEYALPKNFDLAGILTFRPDDGKKYMFVKIEKAVGQVHRFWVKKDLEGDYQELLASSFRNSQGKFTTAILPLPKKIIAYTSGQNELLSNAFLKMRFHYLFEYEEMQKKKITYLLEETRLLFMDYSNNAATLVSSLILGDEEQLNLLKEATGVESLHSFRITIRLPRVGKGKSNVNLNLSFLAEKLKKCATLWFEKGNENNKTLTLDFLIDPATKEAFKDQYGGAFQLFRTFYIMEILNLQLVPSSTRKLVRNAPKWLNVSDELPKYDPSDLVFRIERVKVNKSGAVAPIYYKNLSDGEHQFLQIIGAVMMMNEDGCLFLFDEPETHYNPVWRSKMVSHINKVSTEKKEKEGVRTRMQELVITTHSPFIISDSQRENVFIFKKDATGKVQYRKPYIQTYGASVGFLMEEIFDKEETIADMAYNEIQELKKQANSPEDIERIKEEMLKFGESIEKFEMYNFLSQRNKELGG